MPPQEIAFAVPKAEELTSKMITVAGAGITGAVEGVAVKMAPAMGALEQPFKWFILLGIPAASAALALFTKGILGDLFIGAAAGGAGVGGYVAPELLAPITGAKAPGGGGQLPPGAGVKQLPAGPQYAPERAQARAAITAEI